MTATTFTVRIQTPAGEHTLTVPAGTNLRRALLDAGYSPYGSVSKVTNCGGRGLCATCGVRFVSGEPDPVQWHDRVARAFGYPRLTCQIVVDRDMTIRLIGDKILWGQVLPRPGRAPG
ncbi:MAG: 2Fe-2S iron-sulfur cluster-binding protein [Candidatus Flexifilum sp.]|jgi:ferredoxin